MPAVHLKKLSVLECTDRWKKGLQASPDHRVIVAVHDETVVGFVGAGKTNDKTAGFVTSLFILPEHWDAGIGTALMGEAMEVFRDFKFKTALLYAYCDNTRARRFYERLGWTLNGQTYTQDVEGTHLEMVCYQRAVE